MYKFNFNKKFFISGKKIKNFSKPFIIAEIGNNHNQKFDNVKKLIDLAVKFKCDAVKFQLYKADDLVSKNDKNYKLFKSNELKLSWIKKINNYTRKNKILYFFSIFEKRYIKILEKINVPAYKIASSELLNFELLNAIAKTGKPIFISTGMSDPMDIYQSLNFLDRCGAKKIVLMQCSTSYPLKLEEVNLRIIDQYKKFFNNIPVGFSDHTTSIFTPSFAVAKGVSAIEKHFTLSNKMPGVDHSTSLNPENFKKMVDIISLAYKSNGYKTKYLLQDEKKFGRRYGLYFNKNLTKGNILKFKDITYLRPRLGESINSLELVINRKLKKPVKKNTPIKLDYFI